MATAGLQELRALGGEKGELRATRQAAGFGFKAQGFRDV